MPSSASPSNMNVAGIFRESVKLPSKNAQLILQVTLLILFPLSLLAFLHSLFAVPFIESIEDDDNPLHPKDLLNLLLVETPFLLAFSIISIFAAIATIRASVVTYFQKCSTLTDLISSIRTSWKKPAFTWLVTSLITIGFAFFSLAFLAWIPVEISSNLFLNLPARISMGIVYLYLDSVLSLAIVVSVNEEECESGMKAIGRAEKLIKGKKVEGILARLILVLLSVPILIIWYITITDDDDEIGRMTQLSFGFVTTLLFCVAKMFGFVVYTVFYFECRLSRGETIEENVHLCSGQI